MSDPRDRPDLRVLTDDDLAGAANKLTLKRAKKELAKGELNPTFEGTGNELVVRWSDGVVCRFPRGGLGASSCSCPARRLCLHRVRSLLALRDEELAPAPEALRAWTPADLAMAELEAAPGFGTAVKMLHDGLEATQESPTAVVFPDLGVRVRFVPGEGLEAAICSCRQPGVCLHRVAGALLFHPLPPLPDQADESEVLARVRRVAVLVASSGLDGLPREAREMLDATQQDIVGDGQHEAARDLRRLADMLDAYHAKSARFDGRAWAWTLARLAIRLRLLGGDRLERRQRRLLRGEGRRARIAGKKLELLLLGAEGNVGASGSVVKLHLLQCSGPGAGRLFTAALGRSARGDRPPSPAFLYKNLPVWGPLTAEALVGSAFVLHGPRVGSDGSLSVGGDAKVHLSGGPTAAHAIAPHLVVRSTRELVALWRSERPPLLRDGGLRARLCLLELDPARVPAPRFDETAQRLRAELALVDGGRVRVAMRFRTGSESVLEALEQWPYLDEPPPRVFARVWPGDGAFLAEPIAWHHDQRCTSPGMDPTPETGVLLHPAAQPRDAADRTSGTSVAFERGAVEVFEALLDTLEGWLIRGIDELPAWRRDRLTAHREELAALGLGGGVARMGSVLTARDPEARFDAAAQVIAWTTTAAEVARLDQLG